jgi:hypothetical protein
LDKAVSRRDAYAQSRDEEKTVDTKTRDSRSRSRDADLAAVVPPTDVDHGDADVSVAAVGTFAAGQSAEGRYVVATEAPAGSFADGQTEEERTHAPAEPQSQRRA